MSESYCFDISLLQLALRMLVELQGLPCDSTCILKAVPGKPDIKRTWYSIYQLHVTSRFTVKTSDYDVIIDF